MRTVREATRVVAQSSGLLRRASKRRLRFATAKVLALSAGLWFTSEVRAGDVKGSVRASEEVKLKTVEGVRAPYWQEWNGFIDPKKASFDYAREVSAVLIGPVGSKDAVTVVLKNGTLTPSTVVVQHGTTLRIRNEDDFGHELYVAGLKGFDPVESSPGATRSVQMEQTGVFELRDKLAPYIRGHLHVIAKLTQVVNPSADGSYSFKDVVPGPYTLKVFRGGKEISTSELEVGSKDTEVESITLPAATDAKGK
jgi:plastocyanin